jgi:hypothetical protein
MFKPLRARLIKLTQIVNDIIAHQQWDREKEAKYNENIRSLSTNFFNLVGLQMAIVLASAAFSVFSLRKFFVRKHIF